MLAVLGFVTILLVLALIMSKKVSTLVALIFVPAITGFIAAFINAPMSSSKPHRLQPKRPELLMLSRSSRSAPALPRHFPSSAQIIWARA